MFKALVAALALSLFACAAEPGTGDASEATAASGADIVQADQAASASAKHDAITVVAVAKVRPETRNDFEAAAEDLVRGTRLEDGNISYTMLAAKDDPNTFIFIEQWKNQAAIDAHMSGHVLTTFFGLVKDDFLPGFPSITETNAVSVR